MEHKQIRSDRLSTNHPLLVAQILEAEDDAIFYTVRDPPLSRNYRRRIPELLGSRRIQACFHGWVILSHDNEWSLWNPVTSKFIRLPRLILKDGDPDDILHCCLSSPPDDPASILLLLRGEKPNIVFCRLDRKRKKLRWTEMSYAKQLTSITGAHGSFLDQPICCNGKVYASINTEGGFDGVIQVDIVGKEKEVVISLLPFVSFPDPDGYRHRHCKRVIVDLKRSCEQLFIIMVGYIEEIKKPVEVYLFKLDMGSMVWAEMEDLKDDTVFLVDSAGDFSVNCSPAIGSESGAGGYIHILHDKGKAIYSYHVKDKTISLSFLDLPPRSRTSHISAWAMPAEFRLQGDNGDAADSKQDIEQGKEDDHEMVNQQVQIDLLDIIPFDVLEMIMEFCVGVEYLHFRATCKLCRLAAPVSNGQARKRSQTVSPWLMVFEKGGGIIAFTDPMFGGKYFIKAASPELFYDSRILCSRFGWLLLFVGHRRVAFFNPFTGDIRELPQLPNRRIDSFCFSAPPTSPDCMVVGFFALDEMLIFIHFAAREPASWLPVLLNLGGAASHPVGFPTFCGRDVYALFIEGRVDVFREIGDDMIFSWEEATKEAPRSSCCRGRTEYFLVKCDEHDLLLVMVGEFGESVEVWKLKEEEEEDWEKMDDLGRHTIYICDATCLCMDAKTPEMANKIYFPRLHSDNGQIVFYSLETCSYHTFDGRNVGSRFKNFFGTKSHVYAQAWIEPSCC